MKKSILFFTAVLSASTLFSQSNLNLEIWGGNNMNPAEWTTLNALSQIGTQTTFKETASPGQGQAAAKMVTSFCNLCGGFGIPLDTVAGFIIAGDTSSGTAGIPYTQTPQYLSFRYKANPQPGDAGLVSIQLSFYDTVLDSTIVIAEGIFLESNVVPNWTDTFISLQYYTLDIPDTLIIASSSSASFIYSGSPALGVKQIGSEFFADTFNLYNSFPCSFNNISVSTSSTDESSPGSNDGTASATVSGGYSPFTYLWSNSQSTNSINNLSPGTFTITVTDSVGCSVIGSATVNPFPCDTLLYSDGVNFFPDSVDALSFTVASIDNDSNPENPALTPYGINSEWQVYYEVPSPGDTNYYLGATSYFATPDSADNWLMFGGTTIPTTGATLQWNHLFWDNGFRDGYEVLINTVGNSISDFLTSGTVLYSVADNDPSTNGDTVWATNSVSIDSSAYVGQKVYIAFHHNAYDMFMLLLDNWIIKDCSVPCPAISLTATLANPTTCSSANGSISVIPSGGTSPYSYQWSNLQTGSTATGLNSGTFILTVTDANGCTGDSSFVLTSPSGLTVTTTSTDETAPGANDGTASATASGGSSPYSYNWSNGAFSSTISGLSPGTYTVTVTDAGGCTVTGTATVNAFNCTLTALATGTAETAPNANDGTATSTASGGTTPYSFNWSDGQTSQTATGLSPATYTVTITDAIGCTATATVVIDSFVCVLSATATATGETSIGASDGTASVTTTGGISPYSYLWSNGGVSSTITGLSAGTYFVTVTDGNNCTSTASATVNPASLCNIVITGVSITNPSCSGAGDGQISITNSGGTGTLQFTWSNGNNGSTAYNLIDGTYSVTVSDMNSCTADTTVTLVQPSPLSGIVSHTNETCAGCNDGSATVLVSGGTPPYTYSWTTGGNSPTISNLGAGIYSVFVQDANGCLFPGSDTVQPAILGLEAFQSIDSRVRVYPNPNGGRFLIAGFGIRVWKFEIQNILGETIFMQSIFTNDNNWNIYPEAEFSKGIYFLKIETGGEIMVKKIIVE